METTQKAKILLDFIKFCSEALELNELPKIEFISDLAWVKKNKTFGQYKNDSKSLVVYIKNRNLADICRTLAHELVHHKQNELGMLDDLSGKTGSPIENQAHEVAGIIMRDYGKVEPLIYESIDLYKPNELKSKNIEYKILIESPKRFSVNIKYKDNHYQLLILPMFSKIPSINFGNTDNQYENLNLSFLLNKPESKKILPSIFGLIKYWIDKYDIREFEYTSDGEVRNKIYEYYINKHFPDFTKTQGEVDGIKINIWKKK
jgi:hypothetical protein